MKKQIVTIIAAAALAIGLTACGEGQVVSSVQASPENTLTAQKEEPASPENAVTTQKEETASEVSAEETETEYDVESSSADSSSTADYCPPSQEILDAEFTDYKFQVDDDVFTISPGSMTVSEFLAIS